MGDEKAEKVDAVEEVAQIEDGEVDPEEKKKLVEAEVDAALREELGPNWLETKPTSTRIVVQFLRILTVQLALYFFLVSLSLMSSGFRAIAGQGAGELFVGNDQAIVGLMIGILATVLVQSSSTTTSIIVVLVGNGIVPVTTAIPMVMGANIGTSVTNTIVSLGFADDTEAYRRGFAGATVHDMFNFLNVLVLLPLELLVSALNNGNGGILQIVAERLADIRGEGSLPGGEDFEDADPIDIITSPLLDRIIDIDSAVIRDYAQGFPEPLENNETCVEEINFRFESDAVDLPEECSGRDCIFCEEDQPFNLTLYEIAEEQFDSLLLIEGGVLQQYGDRTGGIIALVLALFMLISSLAIIVRILTAIVQGGAKAVLVRTLNYNFVGGGYLAIVVGCGLTFIVQSSSITTSLLTPLVAVDALSVENMFPFTLGANIGTTGTGLIAAAAEGERDGYVIALVHLFFNIFGTLVWYPIPFMRRIPINAAKFLGDMAAVWKVIPIAYILTVFIIYPLVFFGLSTGFRSDDAAGVTVAVLALLALAAVHGYVIYWYRRRDGKQKFLDFVEKRKAKLAAKKQQKEEARAAAAGGPPDATPSV